MAKKLGNAYRLWIQQAATTTPLTTSALTAAASAVLNFASTTGVAAGQGISGVGVPAGATVVSFTGTTVTMSAVSAGGVASGAAITFTTTGVYAEILGQQSITQGGTAATIDISDKTNSPYSLSAPGLFDMPVSGELFPDLPDASGWGRFETLFLAQTPEVFQIRKGGSSGLTTDTVFTALCYIVEATKSYGKNEVLKVQFKLTLAAAPTVNLLA